MRQGWRSLSWAVVLVIGIGATVLQLREPADGGPHDGPPAAHADHAVAQGPTRLFAWDVADVGRLTIRGSTLSRHFAPSPAADALAGTSASSNAKVWREISEAPAGESTASLATETPVFDAAAYLSLFSQARADRRLESGGATRDEAFGLAPPALTIDVADHSGTALTRVTVGARTPDGYGRYVRVAGQDSVLIVPDYQFRPALQGLGAADR